MRANDIDVRYRKLFGYHAGYLPRDRGAVDSFLTDVKAKVTERQRQGVVLRSPAVKALAKLLDENLALRHLVKDMIDEAEPKPAPPPAPTTIYNIDELLHALDHIVETAPLYNPNPAYLNNFPVSTLFTYMMMTPAGEYLFRDTTFNDAIRVILKEWCAFLDSDKSLYVLNTGTDGWLSESAYQFNELQEFIIPDQGAPHWGWPSFNAYFHRQIKPSERPIASPDDPKVIISANDGTVVRIAYDVKRFDNFRIKAQNYSLVNMLNGHYVDEFVGGVVFQSFLSGADYHRWHAPVTGTVRYTELVEGLMFSDDPSAGCDTTAATYSQVYGANVNTRGLVFIEADDSALGMVCVIPIGITEISSVTINVEPGDKLKKGDELGYFSYGGSSLALVFQKNVIDTFTIPSTPPIPASPAEFDNGPPIEVNAQVAIAK
jgi:phosphatidylserine decarboxylase